MRWDIASHECELRLTKASSELVVSLSHKDNFAFFKQDFGASTLFVRDKRHNYYSLYPGMVVDIVQQVIAQHGFTNVLFLGLSKAGYGALLLSALTAKRNPEADFRALSFSPPTRLYPKNPNVTFPSYLGMIRRAVNNDRLTENLEKYGDLTRYLGLPNVFWRIVYCEGNKADASEASAFIHPNVQKYPLPFSFHGSTIPFTLNRNDPDEIDREVEAIYRDAANDPDLKATVPDSKDHLKLQLLQAKWIPSLAEIVTETLHINYRSRS